MTKETALEKLQLVMKEIAEAGFLINVIPNYNFNIVEVPKTPKGGIDKLGKPIKNKKK